MGLLGWGRVAARMAGKRPPEQQDNLSGVSGNLLPRRHTSRNRQRLGKPLLRAPRMSVGIEVVRALGKPGKKRALPERELVRRLAEIAAGSKLDAPGAAAEIDGIEVELENLRLAQRLLDSRRDDHLADLALIGQIIAHQEVLDDLLGDG